MQPHSVRSEGFQRRQFFQNTTSLFSVNKTPDPIKTVLELRHSGVELSFFSWKLRTFWKTLQPRTLCVLNQDCEMLKWHEIAPYIWRLTFHHSNLSSGLKQTYIYLDLIWDQLYDFPELTYWRNALILGQKTFVLSMHTMQPVRPNSCAEQEPDSIPSRRFYTVQDCCMRTPCILQKCTNTPTCAHSRMLESHLSSSVFSTTWCVLL